MKTTAPVTNLTSQKATMFQIVQNTIAETVGIEPEEITLNMELDELDVTDMPRVVARLNQGLRLSLSAKSVLSECETVEDLVALVQDEQEYEAF